MSEVATQFYTKTGDAWESMLRDIEGAQKSIDIEQYIFSIDVIGTKFLDLLQKKVLQGVRVRLLLDAAGSWTFFRSSIVDRLRKIGIEIRFFNPIQPWRIDLFTSNFFRNHRKIMIIDNTIGHIGGVGIQDHMLEWRDTHMRMTGDIVQDLQISLLALWNRVGIGIFRRYKHNHQFLKKFNLITNSPRLKHKHIYHTLIANIRSAKKYIYLTTPYFIPDIRLFRVLRLAAKKGVDVRILVPEIADHVFVNHARESYFSLALMAGIKIYIYKPFMMHAKTAVIDDEWATAGSFNLDSLSFYFNHEANIGTTDKGFIDEIKKHFHEDLAVSEQIDFEKWKKRSIRKKFLELLTWPFHSIM